MTHLAFRSLSAAALMLPLLGCQPLHDLDAVSGGGPASSSDAAHPHALPAHESPSNAGTGSSTLPAPSTLSPTGDPRVPAAVPAMDRSSLTDTHSSSSASTELGGTSSAVDLGETSSGQSDATSAPTDTANSPAGAATDATTTDESNTTASGAPSSMTESSLPDTTETPSTAGDSSACELQCGLGEDCTSAAQCLSLRCDEQCEPTELIVESDGLDAISTSIKVHVELSADPAVPIAWEDLAVLYFFRVERRDDFVMHFEMGGGTATTMQVGLNDWILVWRTNASGNVPSIVTPFDVQFRSDPWLPDTPESNNNANDHSYREALGPNENIVLCRQTSDGWKRIQGTPPASIADPCDYVGNCEVAIQCDPLQHVE